MRIERDSLGEIEVAEDVYWGAQTQRSFENFTIGGRMPLEVIRALGLVKRAAVEVNMTIGRLDETMAKAIIEAADEVARGDLDAHFPLQIYQTGSGTQTNMNVNEVIAHRANQLLGADLVHPNDHVNLGQSSNDTFPTAMHIAAYKAVQEELLPELAQSVQVLEGLEAQFQDLIKIGRTHLQDATPLSFAQEISGWRHMLLASRRQLALSLAELLALAIGGTAVGTGLNAPADFGARVAAIIAELTGYKFYSAENKFHQLSARDGLSFVHGAIRTLAANALKLANDVRWLASGPRSGLGEITIPANEPGSSIMPGKVNPTQAEALTMVCASVFGHDTTIAFAASQGNFELNVYMPVMIATFLDSVNLLTSGLKSFRTRCLAGIRPNTKRIAENLERSLMLVTALTPRIGYDRAAQVAKYAYDHELSLEAACVELKLLSSEDFQKIVRPELMIGGLIDA